jgi:diaminopimelate decarboxylase
MLSHFHVFAKEGHYSVRERELYLHTTKLSDLVRQGERPLYVLDEERIKKQIRSYQTALKTYYPHTSTVYFASKALQNLAVCKLMHQEGAGLDVCSLGEMYVAAQAGVPFSCMILHGNNKSEEELKLAISSGIHRIIIDSIDEAHMICEISSTLQKSCAVLIRMNPEIEVSAHKHNATGVKASKFGIPFGEKSIALIKMLSAHPWVEFKGLHYHIGSQIFVVEEFLEALDIMMDHLSFLYDTHGIFCSDLNVGGGIGVRYMPQDIPIPIDAYINRITEKLLAKAKEYGLPLPHLSFEPGRSIVCEAGCTLYRIGIIKELEDGVFCAGINGGMTDNIRPAMYQATYFAVVANKMDDARATHTYKIVGKCCESGDVLIERIGLPPLERDDVLAVFSTGAYTMSLASNYNKHTLPGMVLVNGQGYRWIVKEQPLEDLIRYDIAEPL